MINVSLNFILCQRRQCKTFTYIAVPCFIVFLLSVCVEMRELLNLGWESPRTSKKGHNQGGTHTHRERNRQRERQIEIGREGGKHRGRKDFI